MIYIYLVVSAALIPILDNFFAILREPYSWWLVPVLFVSFFVGFIILQMAVFAITIAATDLNKEFNRRDRFFRFMIKISLPIIIAVARVKINAKGIDKLPKDTLSFFVCNHQHDFDPVIMLSVFPDANIGFIGKKEIYKTMPFIARGMHRINSLPIDRENNREAAKTIIKAIKTIESGVASIALFPEGYVSKSCELLPFRNGCFKIATKAKAPIAVCVINNTRQIPKNIFRRKTEVEFRLIDVIYPEKYADMSTAELGDLIHEEMQSELAEIRK